LKSINDLSDEELVREIVKTNNTHLFAFLYDRYANRIYNKCLGFSKSREEAQDLTHDIFIQLFVKLKSFKEKSKFSTWLYSFTYNFCVNYIQRNTHKRIEKTAIDASKDYINLTEYNDSSILELKSEKLAKVLNNISPSDKMILLLKYQDNATIKEIQQLLQIGESAVKMRLKRAKSKLMEAYLNS